MLPGFHERCGEVEFDADRYARPDTLNGVMHQGTVTLIEMCSGAIVIRGLAPDHAWVVDISSGGIERDDLIPGREAVSHFGSPLD